MKNTNGFEERRLPLAQGQEITARFFTPKGSPAGAVIVAAAMGTPQTFYTTFAAWLRDEGFLAVTFDYRGIGLSRRGSLRQLSVDVIGWAQQDCAAAIDATAARAGNAPLYWVGHSLGGQILAFIPGLERLARVITVGTGSGYWRELTPGFVWRSWYLWHVAVPLFTALFGYFPGRRMRKVGDLPAGVIRQWRRWCLDPDYAAGAEGPAVRRAYAEVRTPIVALSFPDDEMMSARSIEALHALYVNAPRIMRRIAPAEVGMKRIGHFGFFRAEAAEPLWRAHLLPLLGPAQ